MKRLLCLIGIHNWFYFQGNFNDCRECKRCEKLQKIGYVMSFGSNRCDWVDYK